MRGLLKFQSWKDFINTNNFSFPKQDVVVDEITTNLSFCSGNLQSFVDWFVSLLCK